MLIPKEKGQPINNEIMEKYTPAESKIELFDGDILPFYHEREKLILMCLYNIGLENFIQILPQESKETLYQLLNKEGNYHIPIFWKED